MVGMPEKDKANEEKLLKLAQSGQVEAYGALYELHAPLVYRYLVIRLGHSQDAEDLTTEVFLKAWNALPRFRYQGISFAAYLLRIARNAAIDQVRKRPPPISLEQAGEPADNRPGLLDRLVKKQEEHALNQAILALNEDYQKILILRFIEEKSVEEAAEIMGRSAGATRVLQHRALQALRKHHTTAFEE